MTFVVDPQFAHCTRCGSSKTTRSRARWYDRWVMRVRNKEPYRCFDCNRRFWLPPRTRSL